MKAARDSILTRDWRKQIPWSIVLLLVLVLAATAGTFWLLAPWASGQVPLVTPTATCTPFPPTRTPTPTPTPSASPTFPVSITHTVLTGETLSSIAEDYDVTVASLAAANDMTGNAILHAGQVLAIPLPTSDSRPSATPTPPPVIHIVREGDTLGAIALFYDTTIEAIVAANDLKSSDLIRVGQALVIAGARRTPTPTVFFSPTPTVTCTPAYTYPAPALLSPPDGAFFQGPNTTVFVNWTSVGILAPDEWYVLRVQRIGGDRRLVETVWLKDTNWRIPASWRHGGGRFQWYVVVVQKIGNAIKELSPVGELRTFSWY
ncbi:MAG: LysM peptidoglycan-binding domain-containing protein [Chloroflexi bacterium]|nr:LysM peptidoglycan-binding domain-containing protein [Chloroflexota bacterium]